MGALSDRSRAGWSCAKKRTRTGPMTNGVKTNIVKPSDDAKRAARWVIRWQRRWGQSFPGTASRSLEDRAAPG
jgi:hypothetical protein